MAWANACEEQLQAPGSLVVAQPCFFCVGGADGHQVGRSGLPHLALSPPISLSPTLTLEYFLSLPSLCPPPLPPKSSQGYAFMPSSLCSLQSSQKPFATTPSKTAPFPVLSQGCICQSADLAPACGAMGRDLTVLCLLNAPVLSALGEDRPGCKAHLRLLGALWGWSRQFHL